MKQRDSHLTECREISYLEFVPKSVDIPFLLKMGSTDWATKK